MKKGQILLIVGAAALTAALYALPYAPMAQKGEDEGHDHDPTGQYDVLDDVTEVNNELDSVTLALVLRYEIGAERNGDPAYRDSLISLYDMMRKPVPSAHHSLLKARETGEADAWTEAGERFLLNAKYMGDMPRKESWFATARECFEQALKITPDDLDVKVDLGVCLVEGAGALGIAPMEGIGVLKEVEQLDPDNIKALINLGYFSIRSGQFDKAEERFRRVLKVDPNYAEAHLYLADMYEKQQQKDKALEALASYRDLTDDPARRSEVERYMKELSNSIQ